jgi:hypothetical protein
VLGDQIYIAGLIGFAAETSVGKTWMLDRDQVMVDLGITDPAFEELQQQIEARMPGKWDKASATDRRHYIYMRLA